MPPTLSRNRRQELAAFLRTRRARVTAGEVGLPRSGRRRTPGLRREEVASRAGVSTEWYTWLEQARNVRASADALGRIADALRLDPSAARHLLTLAGYGRQSDGQTSWPLPTLSPHLQRVLDRLDPYPAWVYGERWDVIAWNRGAVAVYGDFAAMEGLERNMLYMQFLNPIVRRTLVDWERHTRAIVAKVRPIHARHVDDPWYNDVIRYLSEHSPEFAAWWKDHDVDAYQDGVKVFDHAEAGRLTFDFSVLDLRDERFSSLSLVLYVPQPGTGTLEKLERITRKSPPVEDAPPRSSSR